MIRSGNYDVESMVLWFSSFAAGKPTEIYILILPLNNFFFDDGFWHGLEMWT